MKILTTSLVCLNLCLAQVTLCQAADVVPATQLTVTTTVDDIVDSAERMTGRISNRGQYRVDNVRVLISYAWLWNDDRRTDDPSPGWTEFHTLPVSVEPGQSASFSFEHERGRPARDDGQLVTTVRIVGFTEWKLP
jgi:hypothetical protein